MKIALSIAALFAATIALSSPVSAANPQQSGDNGDCVGFLVLWETNLVQSPLSPIVEVEAGTGYVVSQTGGAEVYVEFYDAGGNWITYNGAGTHSGLVPANAAYGMMCVGATGLDWPLEAPAASATWTYQDGF